MWRSIPVRPGRPSRSSRPSLTRMRPSICSEIETVSTAMKFGCESPHSRYKKCSPLPESLAESLRRTPDRLDPQGLPGKFHHLQRAASETNPEFIFHLLSRIEDSFRSRQAMSACSARLECRNDCPDSAPWWPAPPLRTHGSVMLCLRTHFWRTTG